MSFRRRSTPLSKASTSSSPPPSPSGIRPSPTSGIPITSTGTPSLDALLTPHSGLAVGTSLLIEENGVTDFAGALLRYYAAEGVVQGHVVHIVGMGEGWGRELPGLVGARGDGGREVGSGVKEERKEGEREGEKMKIAWRYERLGEVGGSRAPPTPNRGPKPPDPDRREPATPAPFCHTFDLTKRLALPPGTSINYIPISPTSNPYQAIVPTLTHSLTTTPPHTIHRLIIPTLLSPALYPPESSTPTHLLPFLHSLRSLVRTHSTRLTAMLTLPLSLHPRTTGLVRWIEHLSDGVLELVPFPHSVELEPPGKGGDLEKPQGMAKVHKLPVVTEKGGGGGGGDELAFSLSRRRFVIRKFSLPPVEGDQEAQRGEVEVGKVKVDVEF